MSFKGRKSLPVIAPKTPRQDAPVIDGEVSVMQSPLSQDIPPHVWSLLQEAGEAAAQRLVELLTSPAFKSYSPQAQRGLIELALTRAYGLPVKRALNLNLSTSDADAVAMSLADLAANLPETAQTRAARGPQDVFGTHPSPKPDRPS